MANNWFQNIISDYSRQLQQSDASRAMQVCIGTNVAATWESEDQPWFIAEWALPLLPTSGGVIGNRGQNISFGLPLSVDPNWEVVIHDYDVALRATLLELSAARTQLRIWAFGQFIAVATVSNVRFQMPLEKSLNVNFSLVGCRVYKADAYNKDATDFDTSTPIHMLNIPFSTSAAALATFQANTILYGSEILP
jgi:hypothetical protein